MMMVALLAALGVTTFNGMANLAAEEGRGPLAGIVVAAPSAEPASRLAVPAAADEAGEREEHGEDGEADEGDEAWEEIHETAANATLVLVVLHLGGVALASVAHRENLPRAMITGRKRAR